MSRCRNGRRPNRRLRSCRVLLIRSILNHKLRCERLYDIFLTGKPQQRQLLVSVRVAHKFPSRDWTPNKTSKGIQSILHVVQGHVDASNTPFTSHSVWKTRTKQPTDQRTGHWTMYATWTSDAMLYHNRKHRRSNINLCSY